MHFFRHLNYHTSSREQENYTNDSIFFIYFFCSICLYYSVLNLKILKIHFQIHYVCPFCSVKYLNFSFHTFLESSIMFYLLVRAKLPLFQAPANRLYWRLKKISYRACLLFYFFFLVTKIAFNSLFDLYSHSFNIEFF